MIVDGVETRNIKVEVNSLDFMIKMLEAEIASIVPKKEFTKEYDSIEIRVQGNKIIESYIKEGYDHGHYYKDDETVHTIDRTEDFSEDYINYLLGLSNAIKWLSNK